MLMYEPKNWLTRFGQLRPDGKSMFKSEPAKLIESGKYDLLVDAGAASGVYTIVGAKHCKKVLAYEASPIRFFCLATNLAHHFNVELHYAYVSFKGDTPKWAANFDMVKGFHPKPYNIPVVTLDEAVAPYIDQKIFMKIDVEGNELKVLKGAKTLIDMPNVHWYIECHPGWGGDPDAVKRVFRGKREIVECSKKDLLFLDMK